MFARQFSLWPSTFVVSSIWVVVLFGASPARAQADPNIQSRLDAVTTPLVLSPVIGTYEKSVFVDKQATKGVSPLPPDCTDPKTFIKKVYKELGPESLPPVKNGDFDKLPWLVAQSRLCGRLSQAAPLSFRRRSD